MIYLDHNATTSMHEEVLDAMMPYLRERFGNPSSPHRFGRRARDAIENARGQIAGLLEVETGEVVFTSGGTESINTAISSALLAQPKKTKVLVSAVEHSATWHAAHVLAGEGNVLVAPVHNDGRIDLKTLEELLEKFGDTLALANMMWANNETGVLLDVEKAAELCARHGVAFHTDAVQAVGKIPVLPGKLSIPFLSLSGHKFHGPQGVGALYVRRGMRLMPLMHGGGQEAARRSGTENVAGIVGLGKAAEIAAQKLAGGGWDKIGELRDYFEETLLAAVTGVQIIGAKDHRLANTSCFWMEGISASELLMLLDERGICCSSGSACSSRVPEPSRTLQAHGLSPAQSMQTLRVSLSTFNTRQEIDVALDSIIECIQRLRSLRPEGTGIVSFHINRE